MASLKPLKLAFVCLSLTWVSIASAATHVVPRQSTHKSSIYGVNLGGWLVLEPWITPSVFEEAGDRAVDEYTLSQILAGNARSRLSKHWNSWITADDFKQIAAAGLTHVRIPIGYWAVAPLKGEPYVQGQVSYLDKAIRWAKQSNLKVAIDLHGAPGSQNGFDNSGRRGSINWPKGNTVAQTLNALRALAERYADQTDVVDSIEILNEPFVPGGVPLDEVKQFYHEGYKAVRDINPNVGVAISDAFQDLRSWNGFMLPSKNFHNVFLDAHHYQVFDNAFTSFSVDQHVNLACSYGREQVAKTDKKTFVGEWSAAMTDCAKYLNGRDKGARFDKSFPNGKRSGACGGRYFGSVKQLPDQQKVGIRRFIEAQLDAYGLGAGWFFWTWKTEGSPGWDMQDLLSAGLFPQPFTNRKYGGCK
ncbi:glucan 1,3-beta-glucosidase precursor [Histoplasma capsulatum]|uniref:glucan 1,3-beta-glucosidase n=1 Tax=Ajellomyces capsulatus TaxID=5037 RepID=A0A8A1M711_AJECA|nr:glucan 1,3-beta-glucosidase [Histoplasma mississippiense (nom. inval.)]EDN08074.1 glucan 1,3-beta-glucosidase [Histoplasma mississippiense (nom. inval.)]QSS61799.1 glucan 1,3-beta-glucosidase precursor [Histoplasma capsulatum]